VSIEDVAMKTGNLQRGIARNDILTDIIGNFDAELEREAPS
jgi:hypothetical protein